MVVMGMEGGNGFKRNFWEQKEWDLVPDWVWGEGKRSQNDTELWLRADDRREGAQGNVECVEVPQHGNNF